MADDVTDLKWGLEQVHVGRIKPDLDRANLIPPARPAPAAKALASGIYEAGYLEGTHVLGGFGGAGSLARFRQPSIRSLPKRPSIRRRLPSATQTLTVSIVVYVVYVVYRL